MALPPSAAGAPPGGMMTDPAAGGMGADPMAGGAPEAGGEQIVLTVAMKSDGSYTVYDGDEDDGDGGGGGMDLSAEDADATGDGGTGGGATGQQADSIGQVLKLAMDILQAGKSTTGAPGNADDQLDAGYSASKSPTPATGPSQKY